VGSVFYCLRDFSVFYLVLTPLASADSAAARAALSSSTELSCTSKLGTGSERSSILRKCDCIVWERFLQIYLWQAAMSGKRKFSPEATSIIINPHIRKACLIVHSMLQALNHGPQAQQLHCLSKPYMSLHIHFSAVAIRDLFLEKQKTCLSR
jgi:hypothetical protein